MSPRRPHSHHDDSHPAGDAPEIVRHHPAYRRDMIPETRKMEALAAYFPEKDEALEQALAAVHGHFTLRSERDDPRLGKHETYKRRDFGSVRIDDAWAPEKDGLKRVAFVAAFLRRAARTEMPPLQRQTAVNELLGHLESGTPIASLADKAGASELTISFHPSYEGPQATLAVSGADLRTLIRQAAKDSEKAPAAHRAAALLAGRNSDAQLG